MSLDQQGEPSLQQMKGMLETIQAAYLIEFNTARRRDLNEEFKALAARMVSRFGSDGKAAVESVARKHQKLLRQ